MQKQTATALLISTSPCQPPFSDGSPAQGCKTTHASPRSLALVTDLREAPASVARWVQQQCAVAALQQRLVACLPALIAHPT